MSKINRIRIMNLNYNGNTIRIDDETFDLSGETTLLSLRNGGGKSVIVQMIISLFVNKSYRDFADRPFKSYFTTNRPAFIMTEWKLDNGQGFFLVGMMVRKCRDVEENNNEELEIINFTGSYRRACAYDLDSIPVDDVRENGRVLKGFAACKKEFEELKKIKGSDFNYYDMSGSYQRRAYFNKLREYQIDSREWENIIKKVNMKESGLSELFKNSKDEKGLIENWFLDAVEKKLNNDSGRIKEFQRLAYNLIRQYKANQNMIKRKEIIEQYFQDIEIINGCIDEFMTAEENLERQKSRIAAFIRQVDGKINELAKLKDDEKDIIEKYEADIIRILYEKFSYGIYMKKIEKEENDRKRAEAECRKTELNHFMNETDKRLCLIECGEIYREMTDFQNEKIRLQEKIKVCLSEEKDNEWKVKELGGKLHGCYSRRIEELNQKQKYVLDMLQKTEDERQKIIQEQNEAQKQKELLIEQIASLKTKIEEYKNVQDKFNKEYGAELNLNILGEYEEGALDLYEKECNEELEQKSSELIKLYAQRDKLKAEREKAEEDIHKLSLERTEFISKRNDRENKRESLVSERENRLVIMKYMNIPESEIDSRVMIIKHIEKKISEIESEKTSLQVEKNALERECDRLKQGNLIEIPENVTDFFEKKNIRYTYGMEWLKKNGKTPEENQRLVKNNPFLPYCIIIMDRAERERLSEGADEIYTNCPIPVILRQDLEEAVSAEHEGIVNFGKISFFIMFNSHLLDEEELKRLILEKEDKIRELQGKIEIKSEEIEKYVRHKNTLEVQQFSKALLESVEKEIKKLDENIAVTDEAIEKCRQIKRRVQKETDNTDRSIPAKQEEKNTLIRRGGDFKNLREEYRLYEENRRIKESKDNKKNEIEYKINKLSGDGERLDGEIRNCREQEKELRRNISKENKEVEKFLSYEPVSMNDGEEFEALNARYESLTKGVKASLDELNESLERETKRHGKKQEELTRKKSPYNFREEEYRDLFVSEEEKRQLENDKEKYRREENAVNEQIVKLERKNAELRGEIKNISEKMEEKTGMSMPLDANRITGFEFDARVKITCHEKDKAEKKFKKTEALLEKYKRVSEIMADYAVFEITCHVEEICLDEMGDEELKNYQGTLRADLGKNKELRDKAQRETSDAIRETGAKEQYREDYFKKTFDNLTELRDDVYNLKKQLELQTDIYKMQLERLNVDLANIDKERAAIEETFMEYVQNIDENLKQIDKNSTINIRGRSLKMLKISTPDWETNREYYKIKVRDFVDAFLKSGLAAVEENRNVDEMLGKIITTNRLYDAVVGTGNVEIKMYKIEAEREVSISWSEVSANSGGEGFLSAFIILSCLLSYMRRDESDLFSRGEEGKVLIMDNPFAQTNAVHLLKPLMEMAKKTNTQLICLSGLGGDSIYNRFDNIYVLNLVNSNIHQGMQYINANHIKGQEIKKMSLSEFRIEQQMEFSMFDTE